MLIAPPALRGGGLRPSRGSTRSCSTSIISGGQSPPAIKIESHPKPIGESWRRALLGGALLAESDPTPALVAFRGWARERYLSSHQKTVMARQWKASSDDWVTIVSTTWHC